MRHRYKKPGVRGSITIFAALSFMLVAQLLFVLAEGCRQTEIGKVAQMNSDSTVESLMAEYCVPMWKDYHLLANDVGGSGASLNSSGMKSYVTELSEKNFSTNGGLMGIGAINLLRPEIRSVDFDSYTLLTDQSGAAYVKLVSAYMKDNLIYEAAKKIYNNYEAMDQVEKNSKFSIHSLTDAIGKLSGSKSSGAKPTPAPGSAQKSEKASTSSSVRTTPGSLQKNEKASAASSARTTPGSLQKNEKASTAGGSADGDTEEPEISAEDQKKIDDTKKTLTDVVDALKKNLLDVVVPDGKTVSRASFDTSGAVSHRSLAQGKNPQVESGSWYDKILLQQYLLTYFSCFTKKASGGGSELKSPLSYELEYFVAGKSSDKDNLLAAAAEILAVREAANMLYLYSDTQKRSEVEALSTAIASALLLPVIAPVLEAGIMAAWAFCESVMDVRALLNGKKIALLKSSDTWTSSLSNLSEILSKKAEAKESAAGLDYHTYLGLLLLAKSSGKLAMLAMDLQEKAINGKDGYGDFRMDHCICAVAFTAEYAYSPIFYTFVYLIQTGTGETVIRKSASYSYLKKKGG